MANVFIQSKHMNLQSLYDSLIHKGRQRYWGTYGQFECHHIIPRSLGGKHEINNLVYVPIRVHYLLHLILYKQGELNQIFSVDLIARRMKKKLPKWIRKAINKVQQQNHRNNRKKKINIISCNPWYH